MPGLGVQVLPRRGEHPLPGTFPAGVRQLRRKGGRQFDPAADGSQVAPMQLAAAGDVGAQVVARSGRQHGLPVLVALAAPHRDLVAVEVDVLGAQPATLEEPQTGTVQEHRHEPRCARHRSQHPPHFATRQHRGQMGWAIGPHQFVEPCQILVERVPVAAQNAVFPIPPARVGLKRNRVKRSRTCRT